MESDIFCDSGCVVGCTLLFYIRTEFIRTCRELELVFFINPHQNHLNKEKHYHLKKKQVEI